MAMKPGTCAMTCSREARATALMKLLFVQCMQVLAELIISNESRIIESNSVSFYNRMRSFQFTATIRYQVPPLAAVSSIEAVLAFAYAYACKGCLLTQFVRIFLVYFVSCNLMVHVAIWDGRSCASR